MFRLTQANGTAERDAALHDGRSAAGDRVTLGADRGYDTRGFIAELRDMNVTPHVAQNDTNRRSAIDERTTHTRAMGSVRGNASESKRCSAG